jgi:hypothetical protein
MILVKNLKSNAIKIVISSLIALSLLLPSFTYAANNDDWGFNFTIQKNQANSRTSEHHKRDTANENVAWRVNLTGSEEGWGGITQFWLENGSGHNITPTASAHSGWGNVFTKANSDAHNQEAYLTAQNNDYDNTSYRVSGTWDEETTTILP